MKPAWVLGAAWGVVLALPLLHRAAAHAARARAAHLDGTSRPLRRDAWTSRARTVKPRGPVARVLRDVRWRSMRRAAARDRAIERGVPLALDVVTMAARAGHTPRLAVRAAAAWSPDDVAAALTRIEQRCTLGASFVDALDEVGKEHAPLRELTDALAVAERSGAPVAELVSRVADDARVALRRRAEAHARRVPVRLLFPLVFLVLPAFGLLTVVPALVAGLRHT